MVPRGRRGSKRRRIAVASSSAASAAAAPSITATERLKDPSHAKTLQSGLEALWRDGILCDLTIRLAKGGSVAAKGGDAECDEVLVHSAVVAALSKPLKKMLHGPLACVEEGVLTLQQPPGAGFDGAALRSLMEFMYTGELELTEATTWSLLSVADFFGIDGAKQLVVCFLVESITPENSLGMVEAAERFGAPELGSAALAVVGEHFESIALEGEAWVELSLEQVLKIARLDSLRVTSEMVVLEALVRWMDHSKEERSGAFGEMLKDTSVVRLPQLSADELESVSLAPWAAPFGGNIMQEAIRRAQNRGHDSLPRRYLPPPGSFVMPTTCERTLTGHTGTAYALVPFGEGQLISGSYDRTMKVWDSTSSACERTLQASSCVRSLLQFGDWLFVGLDDGNIMVWNTTNWTHECTLEGHTRAVSSLVMCGDQLISGSWDYAIRVWSTATWTCEHILEGHTNWVRSVVMCGGKLISGSDDTTIKIWNTTTWACERTLTEHSSFVMALASTPDGGKLLSGCSDETVKVWDASTWACTRTLQCEGHVFSLQLCPDGVTIAAGLQFGKISLLNFETGETVRTLEGHNFTVYSLAIQNGELFSGSGDNTIKVWA